MSSRRALRDRRVPVSLEDEEAYRLAPTGQEGGHHGEQPDVVAGGNRDAARAHNDSDYEYMPGRSPNDGGQGDHDFDQQPSTSIDDEDRENDDEDEADEEDVHQTRMILDEIRAAGGAISWFRRISSHSSPLAGFTKLSDVPPAPALQHELALQLNNRTSAVGKRRCELPSLDLGMDPVTKVVGPGFSDPQAPEPEAKRVHRDAAPGATSSSSRAVGGSSCKVGGSSSDGPASRTRSKDRSLSRSRSKGKALDPEPASGSGDGSGSGPPSSSGYAIINSVKVLLRRELGLAPQGPGGGGMAPAAQRHLMCHTAHLPSNPCKVVDQMSSRAYIGQFNDDGRFFVAAFQDRRVRLYDVEHGWRLRKDVTTRQSRWTITDTSLSRDQRHLLYASIIPVVHVVALGTQWDLVESVNNVTEVHEALNFDPSQQDDWRLGRSFGIWSVQWSGDGREIIAGSNDQSLYLYDVGATRVLARLEGHEDDVNSVCYVDSEQSNVIATGSDDRLIKVWDRRLASPQRPVPQGVLLGHTEGLTHLDARGDGRYLLSNAKDQTAKLWDLRQGLRSERQAQQALRGVKVPSFSWDYRWMAYPGAGYAVRHPCDASLMTYRGHSVLQTLIRAYFSPLATTGQRFVYTGGTDGTIVVYDVVTGQIVERLRHHTSLVRDCSWHPTSPHLASVCWDGSVLLWDNKAQNPDLDLDRGGRAGGRGRRAPHLPPPGHDQYDDWD